MTDYESAVIFPILTIGPQALATGLEPVFSTPFTVNRVEADSGYASKILFKSYFILFCIKNQEISKTSFMFSVIESLMPLAGS